MAGKKRSQGDGSITVRRYRNGKGYWYAQWTYKDERGGSRRKGRNFATEKEAREYLREVTAKVDAGAYVVPKKGTVAEWLRLWMAGTTFAGFSPQTQAGYRRHVEQMIPRIGQLQLAHLSGAHLDVMYAELLVSGNHAECCKKKHPCGSHLGASGLSLTSVRHYHATLSSALKSAVKARAVPHAVTKDASPPSPSSAARAKQQFSTWTGEEGRAWIELTRDRPMGPVWHLLLTTGCRRGEILGARWSDLDFDFGTLSIVQTIGVTQDAAGKRHVIVQHGVKGGKPHMISLDSRTLVLLRRQRQAYLADRLHFGARWTENDLIFYRGMGGVRCSRPGEPLDGEWVSKQWREQVDAAGEDVVKPIRLHDTRHTWATLALKAGEPVKVVQERLNHKHPSITMGIYQHTTPGMDKSAAERVAGMFA